MTENDNTYVPSPIDALTNKSAQLHALLEMTYGGAREAFDDMNDGLRDSYLWHCASLAKEIDQLAGTVAGELARASRVKAQQA